MITFKLSDWLEKLNSQSESRLRRKSILTTEAIGRCVSTEEAHYASYSVVSGSIPTYCN